MKFKVPFTDTEVDIKLSYLALAAAAIFAGIALRRQVSSSIEDAQPAPGFDTFSLIEAQGATVWQRQETATECFVAPALVFTRKDIEQGNVYIAPFAQATPQLHAELQDSNDSSSFTIEDIEAGNAYLEAPKAVTPQFNVVAVDSGTPSKRRNSF